MVVNLTYFPSRGLNKSINSVNQIQLSVVYYVWSEVIVNKIVSDLAKFNCSWESRLFHFSIYVDRVRTSFRQNLPLVLFWSAFDQPFLYVWKISFPNLRWNFRIRNCLSVHNGRQVGACWYIFLLMAKNFMQLVK